MYFEAPVFLKRGMSMMEKLGGRKMEGTEKEQTQLLLLEYQLAMKDSRYLFEKRFDLFKYLFGVIFAISGVAPAVLGYIQKSLSVDVKSDYIVLLFLFVVSTILSLLALINYSLLVNWNAAVHKHDKKMIGIRDQVFGPDSSLLHVFNIALPRDPTDANNMAWHVRRFIASAPALQSLAVFLMGILLLVNYEIALWLFFHTSVMFPFRFFPILIVFYLIKLSINVVMSVRRVVGYI